MAESWPSHPYKCQFCSTRFDYPGITPEMLAERISWHLCAERAAVMDRNPSVVH